MKNINLIKTPTLNLAVGEPVLLEDGRMGLKIKGRGAIYDTIPLEDIEKTVEYALNPRQLNS